MDVVGGARENVEPEQSRTLSRTISRFGRGVVSIGCLNGVGVRCREGRMSEIVAVAAHVMRHG